MANETIREDDNSNVTQLEDGGSTTILEGQPQRRETLSLMAAGTIGLLSNCLQQVLKQIFLSSKKTAHSFFSNYTASV